MKEEEYFRIAVACDELLRRPEAVLEWIAIPWLHVLNAHPVNVSQYEFLAKVMELPGEYSSTFHAFREFLRRRCLSAYTIAGLARIAFRAITSSTRRDMLVSAIGARSGGSLKPQAVDAIIVSWLVNVEHLERTDDFYFGALQAVLTDHGLSSLLVLRNQTGHTTIGLSERARRDGALSRLILPDVTSLSSELRFIRRCLKARRHLRQAEWGATSLLDRKIAWEARGLMMSGGVIANLRLHAQIAELCRQLRPSIVITLYEGHAWERCVWHAARTSSHPVLCVGYQHTTLWKHAHAVKRLLGPHQDYDPALILTLGDVTKRFLEESKGFHNTRILTLGTHRRASGDALVDAPRSLPTFLVLPEGIGSECIYLFEFALDCARRLPEARFIFRTHPVLPFERLEPNIRGYRPVPDNVEVSRGRAIEDDFARAAYLLYRGSSTVIYAVLAGLKPFYIVRPDEIDLDPLYELAEWREHVHSVDDLILRYRSHRAEPSSNSITEWQRARDYCDEYVQPIRMDTIDQMIELAREASRRSGE
jgi:hypothetical protein